jgi:hypothetical protein
MATGVVQGGTSPPKKIRPPDLKAKKTKMRNVKLQHKWGHNKKTRLRDFSQLQSCVVKIKTKIRGCVIFLVKQSCVLKNGIKSMRRAVPLSNKPKTTKFLTIFKTILRIAKTEKNDNLIVLKYIYSNQSSIC